MIERAAAWFQGQSTTDLIWVGVGVFAQIMFTMRFLVQWIASEKARRSVVPELFWAREEHAAASDAVARGPAHLRLRERVRSALRLQRHEQPGALGERLRHAEEEAIFGQVR